MQSVSPSPYRLVVDRTRAALPASVLWSALLVFLLTFVLAKSTITAGWAPGIQVVAVIALAGALLMGVLAVSPLPWGLGAGIGLALGPVVAGFAAGPELLAASPHTWLTRVSDGTAFEYGVFDLFLVAWLMWVTGGWLSWCVLRWRQPMLGLVPGAAAFATNVLNLPIDQNGYVLMVLVLTLALLLWSNYTSAVASATRARVKLTGDARWDFWESGLVAMAALIVLGIMLPPLSTGDRTTDIESSALTSWAQFMQTLNHPSLPGLGTGAGGTTGFSTNVRLGGSLKKSHTTVFNYTWTGDYAGPRYFRGVNTTMTFSGEWLYPIQVAFKDRIAQDEIPGYAEDYSKLAVAGFNIKMVSAPADNRDILFYPGQLYHVDRNAVATEVLLPTGPTNGPLATIDRLSSLTPPVSTGTYNITVEYSTATEAELQAAGTAYPDWLTPYMTLPATGYRSPEILASIHNLAVQVTTDAGATTPYAKAAAIEAYLRNTTMFTYTLDVQTPPGTDRLSYFLFKSHKGYCEFFATAMGDMLRSLGIPTRLVNGFGPGNYEQGSGQYVVRGEDAHTWVESYFPTYGWIPFEPTPDSGNAYTTISRGASGPNLCLRDLNCTAPVVGGLLPSPTARPGSQGPNVDQPAPGVGGPGFTFRIPDAGTMTEILGVIVAVLLLVFAAVARYLRPRTVTGVWRRTHVLARLAGVPRRPAETPLEVGRRLASNFPEASDPLRSLARGFAVAAYAPPEVARSARATVMEAWSALRPLLLRRVLSRFRPREL